MRFGVLSILAAVAAFAVTALLGKFLIPRLERLGCGQNIKEIGPKWHEKKKGTPTMGGLMIIVGVIVSATVFVVWYSAAEGSKGMAEVKLWGGLVMGIMYAAIGFIDDYIKVVKRQNSGLSAGQKYILQLGVAILYLAAVWVFGDEGAGATYIPFLGTVELGIWFYIISIVMITGFVNAVNLTDGVDGLCSSVSFFAIVSFMMAAGLMAAFDIGIVAAAVAGGCIGFLLYNFYPAKVFMGDTGSLFLGGMFCAVAYGCNLPVLIPLVGIVYLCEAGSVMLQVGYFKATKGKRLFKMTPIHHHFELVGWSELQISAVFSIVTFIAGVLAVMLAALGRK